MNQRKKILAILLATSLCITNYTGIVDAGLDTVRAETNYNAEKYKDCSFSIPADWEKEKTDQGVTYKSDNGDIFVVQYTNIEASILTEKSDDDVLKGIMSELLDSSEIRDQESEMKTINGKKAAYAHANFINEGENGYIWEYMFDAVNRPGVVSFSCLSKNAESEEIFDEIVYSIKWDDQKWIKQTYGGVTYKVPKAWEKSKDKKLKQKYYDHKPVTRMIVRKENVNITEDDMDDLIAGYKETTIQKNKGKLKKEYDMKINGVTCRRLIYTWKYKGVKNYSDSVLCPTPKGLMLIALNSYTGKPLHKTEFKKILKSIKW